MANMERHKKKKQQGKLDKEDYEKGSQMYFESIKALPKLFIEAKKIAEPYVYLDIRNLILLSIYESQSLDKWISLRIVQKEKSSLDSHPNPNVVFRYKSSRAFNESTQFLSEDTITTNRENILEESRVHPSILVEDKRMVICGISNVLRFLFKHATYKIEESIVNSTELEKTILFNLKKLMGFRGGCLQACAESSIWTKFCEVDMVSSVNEIINIHKLVEAKNTSEIECPETLKRFENHLGLPVKIHNFQRVIQTMKKPSQSNENLSEVNQCLDKELLIDELKHEYAEGPTLLLSDLVLYPSFHVFILFMGKPSFARLFPRTFEWHDKVGRHFSVLDNLDISDMLTDQSKHVSWNAPDVPVESLYLRDTTRYKPSLRQFTRQYEIEEALERVKALNIKPLEVFEEDPNFKWEEIPILAHPEGGCLPLSRLQRKCDQLASMIFYALKVYKATNDRTRNSSRRFRIVDFCSGGGHVGILLAWLLPESEVVLVENKDESLRRAQERIAGLSLSNVLCYQSNLDYFESTFDIGLALHACGTATDLVISKCVKVNASFVSCPCCYGAMQENHILTYPRSTIFKEISIRHYFVLCHASDQTKAETKEKSVQGKLCMQIVDTDRCLYATENNYNVKLCRMVPETASPKNHILVAVSSD